MNFLIYLKEVVLDILFFVGFLAVIKMVIWSIFSGYFSAKSGKNFWETF